SAPRPLAVRSPRLWLATLVVGLALAACNSAPPTDPPPQPDPPPGAPTLSAPATMHGQTRANVQVRAEGAWQLRVLDAQGSTPNIASRISLSRASGNGPANVTLTVDPAGLNHIPKYPFRLQLQAG